MSANDCLNPSESLSFRLGAALRDDCLARFLNNCFRTELAELSRLAPMLRPMLSEGSGRALVFGLGDRVEGLDAAAQRSRGRFPAKSVAKFRKLADAAEAAQVAWSAANMAALKAQRVARAA